MSNKNRDRGFNFERELVAKAKTLGLSAQRAWGSNGNALGEVQEVDLKIENLRVQAKRRKKLPQYLHIPEGCDIVAFREDRGKTLVLVDYDKFLEFILAWSVK